MTWVSPGVAALRAGAEWYMTDSVASSRQSSHLLLTPTKPTQRQPNNNRLTPQRRQYDGNYLQKGVEDLEGRAPSGSGECVVLPQALTDIGHTSHWYPGSRVVDLAYLNEGTVIANFVFSKPGVGRFPNKHGYHVAFFVAFGPRGMNSGQRSMIVMDQWIGRPVRERTIRSYTADDAKRLRIRPADNAGEFYVVMK